MPSCDDLFLAYRQAKISIYFERRGVSLIEIAKFERRLQENLESLATVLDQNGGWFDGLHAGEVWIVPKNLRSAEDDRDNVVSIGTETGVVPPAADIQVRLSPSPECAIVEVLFLWKFGPYLESLLSRSVVGYRLSRSLTPMRRWLFDYWRTRYEEFRTAPIEAARRELNAGRSVLVLSADLASFYDTIDPRFLLTNVFISALGQSSERRGLSPIDLNEYRSAVGSLLCFYSRFRKIAANRTGLQWPIGIPIGALTSRVIANVALATLDRAIEGHDETIMYRRYVDDFVVVARSDGNRIESLVKCIKDRVPLLSATEADITFDTKQLEREGSKFSIQRKKCRAYHLAGSSGLAFLTAVSTEYGRLVSENRAFLDRATIQPGLSEVEDSTLIRVATSDQPITVLRDADQPILRRFAVSNRMRTIERAAVLLDTDGAKRLGAKLLEGVRGLMTTSNSWVENLGMCFRALGLATRTGNWSLSQLLIEDMGSIWADVASLQRAISGLYLNGHKVTTRTAWIWLRNYLHAGQMEAVSSMIRRPRQPSDLPNWLRQGVVERTKLRTSRTFFGRSRLLSRADLRALDREDDQLEMHAVAEPYVPYLTYTAQGPDLQFLMGEAQRFIDLCHELNDKSWRMPAASLLLCTRPPSYFDIARRHLYRTETEGFRQDVFESLLSLVNAIRGTRYREPMGVVVDRHTVEIAVESQSNENQTDPYLILGNLVLDKDWMCASAKGNPVESIDRLNALNEVLFKADSFAIRYGKALLVLPELSLPRGWFKEIARHVARRGLYGLVAGLEYRHDRRRNWVFNQAYALLPGGYSSVATLPWTKGHPAREERAMLSGLGVSFKPRHTILHVPRTTVVSRYGRFSVLICSELIQAREVADLAQRVELLVVPASNKDTTSFGHLIQSVGLQLHAVVAIANNGTYSDCRAWAPRKTSWERDLCRLIERHRDGIVGVQLPIADLECFHRNGGSHCPDGETEWKPLPPDW